jgi:two-component system KDP operon response regulator KdpE
MTKEPLVLIVDDEAPIRDFLRAGLTARGYACEEAATAETGLTLAASLNPDLILLDLGLPDLDGQVVVARLRKEGSVPIVILSARDQEQDKVRALDAGADDYLTKPFGLDELTARIKVALRHRQGPTGPGDPVQTFGDLTWDPGAHRVFVAGTEAHLTPVEYRLLSVLARHPGRILTHAWLLKEVWGLSSLESVHYVRIAMAGLRKKLERDPGNPQFIHTEVGTGYRFFQ